MTRLPESEHELEELVRERTGNIAQYLAAIVESSDDAIVSKDLHGMIRSWMAPRNGSSATRLRKRSEGRSPS